MALFDPDLFDPDLFDTEPTVAPPVEVFPPRLFDRSPEDYSDLITPFHIHRSKFKATVEALASAFIESGKVAKALPEAFDLDFAIGAQLDIVGKWVGRDRFIPYPLETFWFSFDDFLRGFDKAVWKGPYETEQGTYRLADDDFRRLLYAHIGVNQWDGTFQMAKETLLKYYVDSGYSPGALFFFDDRGDSSATFAVAGEWPPPIVMAMLAWPAIKFDVSGGEIRTRVASEIGSGLFGMDVDNEYVGGFDSGSWGVPPSLLINRGTPGVLDFSDPANSALIAAAT